MRFICIVVLLFVVAVFHPYVVVYGNTSSWVLISNRISNNVVLFDFDGDGVAETTAVDNYMVLDTGEELLTNGVPFKTSLIDPDLCLLIYRAHIGELLAFCKGADLRYVVPINETLRVFPRGVIIGDLVITRGKVYVSTLAKAGILLHVNNSPVVLGTEEGRILLEYLDQGVRELVVNLSTPYSTLYSAFYSSTERAIYGLASTDTAVLLFKYSVLTKHFSYVPLPLVRVLQAVSTEFSMYILTLDGRIYRVRGFENPLEYVTAGLRLFYPADGINSFTVLSQREIVKIVDTENGPAIYRYTPDLPGSPIAVDWWGYVIAVATNTGVYCISLEPVKVFIEVPNTVYAGERFIIKVTGDYNIVYVRIGEQEYRSKGEFVLNASLPAGSFTVRARACKGVYCIIEERAVNVIPRSIQLLIEYPAKARPYQSVIINVTTVDILRNKSVEIACSIVDPRGKIALNFTSGTLVKIPAVPYTNVSVFTIMCGGGNYYEAVTSTIEIALTELYSDIKLVPVDPSTIRVVGYDLYTGEHWDGVVMVKTGAGRVVSGYSNVDVALEPGLNELVVLLIRDNVVVLYKELVIYNLVHREPVYVTTTEVVTAVVTTTGTVTVPVIREVKIVDPLIIVAVAALTAGAVYALLILLRRPPIGERV